MRFHVLPLRRIEMPHPSKIPPDRCVKGRIQGARRDNVPRPVSRLRKERHEGHTEST